MSHAFKYRCHANIDLAALERNVGRIRTALPRHIRYISVVKADAYGHGLAPMATRLMQSGADAFAVANVAEAADLRTLGQGWKILVLGATLPEERPQLFRHKLIPALSSSEEIASLNALGAQLNQSLYVDLKIDTGMGRSGVWHEYAEDIYNQIKASEHLHLHGIFTHFSSADKDPDFTNEQRLRFLRAINKFQDLDVSNIWIHADNSAGLESFAKESPFNAVRIGLLQFGLPPHPESLLSSLRTEPVMRFETRICLLKELPQGAYISYGRTCQLKRDSRIAILAAGYGDGISTQMSNRGCVLIRGQRCPILGRITMDQVIVDVTDLPSVEIGDTATLLGSQGEDTITATEYAAWSNSIAWEVFCSITKRVPRLYQTDRTVS